MHGAFRGMPARTAIVLALVSACSQEPQFVEKDMTPGFQGAGDATGETCAAVASPPSELDVTARCLTGRLQIAIEPSTVDLKVGEAQKLQAFLVLEDGRKLDVTAQADWSAVNISRVQISGKGSILAVGAGEAEVRATYLKSSGSSSFRVREINVTKDPELVLKVQGRRDKATLPAGLETRIEWVSKDVDSCHLLINGREFDRRPSGLLTAKLTVDGKVELFCKAVSGEEFRDEVDVFLTKPEVSFIADGGVESLILNGPKSVDLRWASTDATNCEIFAGGQKFGSGISGDKELLVTRSQLLEAVCKDDAGNTARSVIDLTLQYQSRITFSPGNFDQIAGGKTERPVSIVFALDVTGSMSRQIDTVKTGVQEFVTQLSARGFRPKIGVIPFRDKVPEGSALGDVPEGRLELTDKIEEVKRFVGTLKASGGGDANEAALGAVRSGVNALSTGDQRSDAIKIIMLVTDQPGHSGALTTDCAIDSLVNQFKGLTASEQMNFKLFYSTPTSGTACSGYASATQQMSALLSRVLTAESNLEKRGGVIAWPFANKNLVDDVVTLIEKVNPPIDLACLNTKATLSIDGRVQFIEELRDYAGTLRLLEAGGVQSVAKTLTPTQHEVLSVGGGSLVVSRCCFSKAAAKAGNFNICLKPSPDQALAFGLE